MCEKSRLIILKNIWIVCLLLVVGALIGESIYRNVDSLKAYLYQIKISNIILSISLYCGALAAQGFYNIGLIFEGSTKKFNPWEMLREYFVSKLVRYIPGKIWGVFYQSERLKIIVSKKAVWMASFIQFIDANLFSGVVIITASIWYFVSDTVAVLLFIILSFIFCLVVKCRLVVKLALKVVRRVGITEYAHDSASTIKTTISRYLLLLVDWLLFVGVWIVISVNYLPVSEIFGLAIIYAGASIIGVIVIVLPSGLFVREASFISIAVWFGYDEVLVTFLSILVRLVLTLADVVSGAMFSILFRGAVRKIETYEY